MTDLPNKPLVHRTGTVGVEIQRAKDNRLIKVNLKRVPKRAKGVPFFGIAFPFLCTVSVRVAKY